MEARTELKGLVQVQLGRVKAAHLGNLRPIHAPPAADPVARGQQPYNAGCIWLCVASPSMRSLATQPLTSSRFCGRTRSKQRGKSYSLLMHEQVCCALEGMPSSRTVPAAAAACTGGRTAQSPRAWPAWSRPGPPPAWSRPRCTQTWRRPSPPSAVNRPTLFKSAMRKSIRQLHSPVQPPCRPFICRTFSRSRAPPRPFTTSRLGSTCSSQGAEQPQVCWRP